jgi:hypothetical protein
MKLECWQIRPFNYARVNQVTQNAKKNKKNATQIDRAYVGDDLFMIQCHSLSSLQSEGD